MPMRLAHVSREGKFTKPKHDKLGYVTMMELRALMVFDCRDCLAKACTIASRYGAVRRQGSGPNLNKEPKVLDYPLQLYRLVPLIATCFAFHFTGRKMLDMISQLRKDVRNGDSSNMAQAHCTLSGLKAICTRICTDGIEECRKCCGGHGYLLASGIPELLGFTLQYATAEGDNYVMAQQASRYLLKGLLLSQNEPDKLVGDMAYLRHIGTLMEKKCSALDIKQIQDPGMLQDAHFHHSCRLLADVGQMYTAELEAGKSVSQAWARVQVMQHKAVQAHVLATMVSSFFDQAQILKGNGMEAARIGQILQLLAALFALVHIEANMGDYLESEFFNAEQVVLVRSAIQVLLLEIRPNIVALVDAFDFSDLQLGSALGRKDGNAYRALFEATRGSNIPSEAPPHQHLPSRL